MIITTMRRGKLSIEPGCRTVWLREEEYRRLVREQQQEACEALTPVGLSVVEVDGELRVVANHSRAAQIARRTKVPATRLQWWQCAGAGVALGIAFVAALRGLL